MEHHQHTALAVPVKGGQQQLQKALALLALLLQIVGGLDHVLQGTQVAEQLLIGGLVGDGPAQHLLSGGIGVDDLPLPGEGHHAVRHVEEQGIQLVALVLHLAQGVPELPGHVVKGVGEDTDLIPGGHLDFS